MQQVRHFGIKSRFTLGKSPIQIKHDEFFHSPVTSDLLRIP
jgi:hypothetical protein